MSLAADGQVDEQGQSFTTLKVNRLTFKLDAGRAKQE
jgi:hypothetical protein